MEPLVVRISSSTEWLGKRNERSRETLSFETRAERDLMLVLHRPIEPTTQSGHWQGLPRCRFEPLRCPFMSLRGRQ